MRGLAAFAVALALVGCSEGAQRTRPTPSPTTTSTSAAASPSPSPLEDDVTMTTRQFSGRTGDQQWSVEVPTLRGLPKEIAAKVNQLLAKDFAPGPSATPAEDDLSADGTVTGTVTLYEVNDWYVTVRSHTLVTPRGGQTFSAVAMYTFSRADGTRLAVKDLFRPGTIADAITAINAHARTRLHEIFGPEGDDLVDGGTREIEEVYDEFAPLPEGLEVTFDESLVAPHVAGNPVVTVPWETLSPWLAVPPPTGERNPPYRDGLHVDEDADVKAAIGKSVKGRFLYQRLERSQYAGAEGYAAATLVPYPGGPTQIVTLKNEGGFWKVVPCATVPATVVRSMMLRCST